MSSPTGVSRELTDNPFDNNPQWSPGGTSIAFQRNDRSSIELVDLSLGKQITLYVAKAGGHVELVDPAWSRSGEYLLAVEYHSAPDGRETETRAPVELGTWIVVLDTTRPRTRHYRIPVDEWFDISPFWGTDPDLIYYSLPGNSHLTAVNVAQQNVTRTGIAAPVKAGRCLSTKASMYCTVRLEDDASHLSKYSPEAVAPWQIVAGIEGPTSLALTSQPEELIVETHRNGIYIVDGGGGRRKIGDSSACCASVSGDGRYLAFVQRGSRTNELRIVAME